jgi:hypothetical protein
LNFLHWLRVTERVKFKVAVLTYKLSHGAATSYLGSLTRVSEQSGTGLLRAAGLGRLVVPPHGLPTIGARVFSLVAPSIWNCLPFDVTSAPSVSVFKKTLRDVSFPHLLLLTASVDIFILQLFPMDLETVICLGHVNNSRNYIKLIPVMYIYDK